MGATSRIRPYAAGDRAACLALLRSNVPEYFVGADEAELERFLGALPGPYFVLEDASGRLIAAGGIALDDSGSSATLCWGIVSRELQRQGHGSTLLRHRLDTFLPGHPQVQRLRVNTTQKVQAFYERHGFAVVEWTPGGYGPGLDHVRLERLVPTGLTAR